MIKLFINGQEIEIPKELTPLIKIMNKSIIPQPKPVIFPFPLIPPKITLNDIIPGEESKSSEDYGEIFKDIELDLDECIKYGFSFKARVPKALLNLYERVNELEVKITYLEDLLIRKQLEEEKAKVNNKKPNKKKIVLKKTKDNVKKPIMKVSKDYKEPTKKPKIKPSKRVLKKTTKTKVKEKK